MTGILAKFTPAGWITWALSHVRLVLEGLALITILILWARCEHLKGDLGACQWDLKASAQSIKDAKAKEDALAKSAHRRVQTVLRTPVPKTTGQAAQVNQWIQEFLQ